MTQVCSLQTRLCSKSPNQRKTGYSCWYKSVFVLWVLSCNDAPLIAETTIKSFGEHQLEIMLGDRPELVQLVRGNDKLASWLVSRFNRSSGVGPLDGAHRGTARVHWDNRDPGGAIADSKTPYGPYPAIVRVTASNAYSPLDKLIILIYALFRLDYISNSNQLADQARAGELTRDEYAMGLLRLEFQTTQDTKNFLKEHGLLRKESDHSQAQGTLPPSDKFEDFPRFIESLPGRRTWKEDYGKYYDTLMTPQSKPTGAASAFSPASSPKATRSRKSGSPAEARRSKISNDHPSRGAAAKQSLHPTAAASRFDRRPCFANHRS
jgi:hypothetical protein